MQKNHIAKKATIMLTMLWLLSSITMFSYAENIPISEEGLQKIGLNKIRLENGIGVIVFNLSETGDYLRSDGYLTMSNTYNTSITMSCDIVTKLSVVDLDMNGNPRFHLTISNNTLIKPVPTASWVSLEENKAVINPLSIYNYRYTINIPLSKDFNSKEGYLLYIHITKDMSNVTGANIGIDYLYKIFIIFTGETRSGMVFSQWMFLLLLIPGGIGSLLFYKTKKKKHIKYVKNIEPVAKTVYAKPVYVSRLSTNTMLVDKDVELRNKIDDLLRRGNV
jgi:hypothetical protein